MQPQLRPGAELGGLARRRRRQEPWWDNISHPGMGGHILTLSWRGFPVCPFDPMGLQGTNCAGLCRKRNVSGAVRPPSDTQEQSLSGLRAGCPAGLAPLEWHCQASGVGSAGCGMSPHGEGGRMLRDSVS